MGFYQERIVPFLIQLAMRNKRLRPYRERVVGAAEGYVLERKTVHARRIVEFR